MHTILLAEDDSFLLKIYKAGLSEAGYTVITASNGVEALEKMKSDKPDLVLLDMLMPEKDGFDVLADAKADSSISKIPVIALTSLGQESDIEKITTLGAADYCYKSGDGIENALKKVQKFLPTAS